MIGILIEIQPRDPATGIRQIVRVGSASNGRTLSLAPGLWQSAIIQRPRIMQQLMDEEMSGQIQVGRGDVSLNLNLLNNIAGKWNLEWEGSPITIWSGDGPRFSDMATEFVGLVTGGNPNRDTGIIQLTFEVDRKAYDVPMLNIEFNGGGGINGDPEFRGTLKPAGFGSCTNVEVFFFNRTKNIGIIDGYGNTLAIPGLYEDLGPFGASIGNFADYAALEAAVIPAGRWATSIAHGLIRLGAPPVGVITCDAEFGSGSPGGMIQRILQAHCGISLAKIDTADLAAMNARANAVVGGQCLVNYWTNGQISALQLIQDLCRSVLHSPLLKLNGQFGVASVIGGATALTLKRRGGDRLVTAWQSLDPTTPFWRMKMNAERTYRVHSPSEIAFENDIVPLGDYQAADTYRIGNVVRSPTDGNDYIWIAALPGSGIAPPNAAYWELYQVGPSADTIRYSNNLTLEQLRPAQAGADVTLTHTAAAIVAQAPAATDSTIQPGATNDTGGDTRNDNFAPLYYRQTWLRRLRGEFKLFTAIGTPSGATGTYGALQTYAAWADHSGGTVAQRVTDSSGREFIRYSEGLTPFETWGAWQPVYSGNRRPAFGGDLLEAVGGAVATLPNFRTIEGTSAAILQQGPGATALSHEVMNNRVEASVVRISHPLGGAFNQNAADVAGAIRIDLPVIPANALPMLRLIVDVFEYGVDSIQTYELAGYCYYPNDNWAECSAKMVGSSPAARPVRFGRRAGRWCIWIGNHNGVWQYPSIVVRDVQVSFDQISVSTWQTGWAVSTDTVAASAPFNLIAQPYAGDAIFGGNIREDFGGALALINAFKTILGISSGFLGQGPGATASAPAIMNSYVGPGQNLIPGSDQTSKGLLFLRYNPDAMNLPWGPPQLVVNGYSGWTTANYELAGNVKSVAVFQNGSVLAPTFGYVDYDIDRGDGQRFVTPCAPGETMIASAFLASHRCLGRIYLAFENAAGNIISYSTATMDSSTEAETNRLSEPQFRRVFLKAVAPAGTYSASLVVAKGNTFPGQPNSYWWCAGMMLERAAVDQIGPSPYMPGPPSTARQVGYLGELDANRTQIHISAGFSGQGTLATANSVSYGSGQLINLPTGIQPGSFFGDGYLSATFMRYSVGGPLVSALQPGEAGANVTEGRTAAAIAGQTSWATYGGLIPTNVAAQIQNLNTSGHLGSLQHIIDRRITYTFRADGTTSITESLVITPLGTAAAIAGQGTGATANTLAQLDPAAASQLAGATSGGGSLTVALGGIRQIRLAAGASRALNAQAFLEAGGNNGTLHCRIEVREAGGVFAAWITSPDPAFVGPGEPAGNDVAGTYTNATGQERLFEFRAVAVRAPGSAGGIVRESMSFLTG